MLYGKTIILFFLLLPLYGHAQLVWCTTEKNRNSEAIKQIEERVRIWRSVNKPAEQSEETIHIPVVVHVVFHNNAENFSDALIQDCIANMNKGFRKMWQPPFIPRPIFDSLWADTKVEFCLATTDPDGLPADGITRTQTAAYFQSWELDNIKHDVSGGTDAWPVSRYLNIWIAPINSGGPILLGNTVNNNIFSDPATVEGIVINSAYPNFLSEVFTHEAGHFTGLYHTFDNETELVDDTPWEGTGGHQYINSVSSTCQDGDLDSNTSLAEDSYWGNINPPDMIENFMGYDRPCQFMFTKGQKERMVAMLNLYYSGMINTNCGALSVTTAQGKPGNIELYPNPASGSITITADVSDFDTYTIFSSLGNTITEGELSQRHTVVRVKDLASGLYFVNIKGKNGSVLRKFLKM